MLRLTPFAREEFDASYEPATDPIERARRTLLRSLAGFGSAAATKGYKTGFRANSNRSGTTPAHDWRSYPDHVEQFAERLQGVVIEQRPFLEVMRQHDSPYSLHFVDPPYLHSTRRPGNPYDEVYEHDMTDDDHRRLAEQLHALRGKVVICGYPSGLYGTLYSSWLRIARGTHADGARPRTECLWLNPLAADELRQKDMFESAGIEV
jgi:DNA adenine methylase